MGLARTAFLKASHSRWLAAQATRRRFTRRAVHRFMPGEDLDAAIAAAHEFGGHGIATVLTQLGENVTTVEEAERVTDHYRDVLARVRDAGLPSQISVKLTHLGLDVDAQLCADRVRRLATQVAPESTLWIDMEGSAYTDVTLELYRRVRAEHPNVALCLQAYLRRTVDDLERLLPLGPTIRLVKGAYNEPPEIAFTKKREVDANYFALATRLLADDVRGGIGATGFGTHDMRLVGAIAAHAERAAVPRDAFEIQMLYGIRRADQVRLARDGYRVRVLISYGPAWFPWYMRRLAERPANVWFVVKSILGG